MPDQIRFEYKGKTYVVPHGASEADKTVIVLAPDKAIVISAWLESFPPQPKPDCITELDAPKVGLNSKGAYMLILQASHPWVFVAEEVPSLASGEDALRAHENLHRAHEDAR
jgi:hypothetical protein